MPSRARKVRAPGVRDPDHDQDFGQSEKEPAIISVLSHPALRKGEREQHVEGHEHGKCRKHRPQSETLRTQIPGQVVAGIGGQKRRQHDERAAAVEPCADGRPEQQHDIGSDHRQARQGDRKRLACFDCERRRKQDHRRHGRQLQNSKEQGVQRGAMAREGSAIVMVGGPGRGALPRTESGIHGTVGVAGVGRNNSLIRLHYRAFLTSS